MSDLSCAHCALHAGFPDALRRKHHQFNSAAYSFEFVSRRPPPQSIRRNLSRAFIPLRKEAQSIRHITFPITAALLLASTGINEKYVFGVDCGETWSPVELCRELIRARCQSDLLIQRYNPLLVRYSLHLDGLHP